MSLVSSTTPWCPLSLPDTKRSCSGEEYDDNLRWESDDSPSSHGGMLTAPIPLHCQLPDVFLCSFHCLDWCPISSIGHCSSHNGQSQDKLRKKNSCNATFLVPLVALDTETLKPAGFYLLFHFGRWLEIICLKGWVSVVGMSLLTLHSSQIKSLHFCYFNCFNHELMFFKIICWNSLTVSSSFYQAVCSGKQVYPFIKPVDLLRKYKCILKFILKKWKTAMSLHLYYFVQLIM